MSVTPASLKVTVYLNPTYTPEEEARLQSAVIDTQAAVVESDRSEPAERTYGTEELHRPAIAFTLRDQVFNAMRPLHKHAVQTSFLQKLLKKHEVGNSFCSRCHVQYLGNLRIIHTAIEKAQAALTERYGPGFFVFPELFRSGTLEADIATWRTFYSKGIKEEPIITAFVDYLDKLQSEDLPAVVGTLWTLYGTLLNGGQSVGQNIRRAFPNKFEENNIPMSEAHKAIDPATFFSLPFDIATFKQTWYANMDALPGRLGLSSPEQIEEFTQRIIVEATLTMATVLSFVRAIEHEEDATLMQQAITEIALLNAIADKYPQKTEYIKALLKPLKELVPATAAMSAPQIPV